MAEACETANRFRERDVAAREANPYNGEANLQRAHPGFAADDRCASGPDDSPVRAVAVRSPLVSVNIVSVKCGAAKIVAGQAVILDTKTVDQRTMNHGTMDKTGKKPQAQPATRLPASLSAPPGTACHPSDLPLSLLLHSSSCVTFLRHGAHRPATPPFLGIGGYIILNLQIIERIEISVQIIVSVERLQITDCSSGLHRQAEGGRLGRHALGLKKI